VYIHTGKDPSEKGLLHNNLNRLQQSRLERLVTGNESHSCRGFGQIAHARRTTREGTKKRNAANKGMHSALE
jgi:hypothetical protein